MSAESSTKKHLTWQSRGHWQEVFFKGGTITLEPRPVYCDRGNWLAKVFTHSDVSIDAQDGWPRYFFDEDRAKLEIEAWIVKRGLLP